MSDLIREGWEAYTDIPAFIITSGLEIDRAMVMQEALKAFYAGSHHALQVVLHSAGREIEQGELTVRTYSLADVEKVLETALECVKEVNRSVELITLLSEGKPN